MRSRRAMLTVTMVLALIATILWLVALLADLARTWYEVHGDVPVGLLPFLWLAESQI